MLYLKKYLSDGLIQTAVLLSLCGVMVDVGLDSYLPRSWHDMILGPTSALTQTQFHDHQNQLEQGHGVHPKSMDAERFFTARRLLGWVRSLDRLQVPHAELQTWLVQREPDAVVGGHPDQTPAQAQRQRPPDPAEPTDVEDNLQEDQSGQIRDDGGRNEDSQSWTSNREFLPFLTNVPDHPSMDLDVDQDLDLQWQDLMSLLEPENTDVEMMEVNQIGDLRPEGNTQDLLETQNQSELEPVLLPLTPSSQHDDHNPFRSTRTVLRNSDLDPLEDFLGLHMDDNLPGFGMSLLAPDAADRMEPEDLLVSSFSPSLLDQDEVDGLPDLLSDLFEDVSILDDFRLLDLDLEEGFSPEMAARLEEEGYLHFPERGEDMTGDQDQHSPQQDAEDETDSDSGLSLDCSHSPASSSVSEGSTRHSFSSSSSSPTSVGSYFFKDENRDTEGDLAGPGMFVEMTIKQEELEEEVMGAVGGCPGDVKLFPDNYGDHKLFHGFAWLEDIGHDHTYHQPRSRQTKPSMKHFHGSISDAKARSQDERRARAFKIPFSNELVINLPVEQFNDLLSRYHLSEEQIALIRDIRRRGKNKVAAQNCRRRKQDMVLGLEDDVSGLRSRRSRLLREKRDALRELQEMKRRLGTLYQETFSKLRDEEGRPLNATQYMLQFGPDQDVTVAVIRADKSGRKQRDRRK